ncbi:aldose epimerase family protein [Streptomyces fildesensis]|uniref:Aldose 1-epimerase n=1 Tax=Streptomyces fildesensis TaxID=375757 RepID=A0ABW8C5A2_9ACTN
MPRPAAHREPFGVTPDGRAVDRWTLRSTTGVTAEILTYGGVLHALTVPDRAGHTRSVVLALPDLESYAAPNPYVGALVGRYANRIAGGRFTLDGQEHHVPANDHGHALHGGPEGFNSRVWQAEPVGDGADVRLTLRSPDGDMGFPGELTVTATYALDDRGTLSVTFEAVTDRPTVINLTHHAYFNLAGAGAGARAGAGVEAGSGPGSVLDHWLSVGADSYLPVSADAIPLGPAREVTGTPFDFTAPRRLGDGLATDDPQLEDADGYDHCWVLRPPEGPDGLRSAALLRDPASGRELQVWTTEPGLQVYTSNHLDGSLADAEGNRHERHGAICLETQHFPDSPNRPSYPTTVLRPGTAFRSRTEFRFPHLC